MTGAAAADDPWVQLCNARLPGTRSLRCRLPAGHRGPHERVIQARGQLTITHADIERVRPSPDAFVCHAEEARHGTS